MQTEAMIDDFTPPRKTAQFNSAVFGRVMLAHVDAFVEYAIKEGAIASDALPPDIPGSFAYLPGVAVFIPEALTHVRHRANKLIDYAAQYPILARVASWGGKEQFIRHCRNTRLVYATLLHLKLHPKHYATLARSLQPGTRFSPAIEAIIMSDATAAITYSATISSRWHKLERKLLSERLLQHIVQYAFAKMPGRWPEAEPIILTSKHTSMTYIAYVVDGPWMEFEQRWIKDMTTLDIIKYVRTVKECTIDMWNAFCSSNPSDAEMQQMMRYAP